MAPVSHRQPDRCRARGHECPLVQCCILTDIDRQRLNRGHRYLGRRRRGEVIQRHAGDVGQEDRQWQACAQDRDRWASLGQSSIARVSRRAHVVPVHRKLHVARRNESEIGHIDAHP